MGTGPRLSFVVLSPPGDSRLAASLDLLKRQGLPPGEHEILVAAHGRAIGIDRAAALATAVAAARAHRLWVLDVADRPAVNTAARLLERMDQEKLDLLAFRLRSATPSRAERLRFDLPASLPPSPIMEGPSLLSRHDFQPELACVLADTALWREAPLVPPPGIDPVVDRALMPQLALRAKRAAFIPTPLVRRRRDSRGPELEDAATTATALRDLVERLKLAGNPSANLALRLLRRAELIAIEAQRGLILSGASRAEIKSARRRLRAAGALPIRHLGRPEATLAARFWEVVGRLFG